MAQTIYLAPLKMHFNHQRAQAEISVISNSSVIIQGLHPTQNRA